MLKILSEVHCNVLPIIACSSGSDLVHVEGPEHDHDDEEAEGREPRADYVRQLQAFTEVER